MKILYAIQGTGNGHFSRAEDVIPILKKKGDLDILVSGTQNSVPLDHELAYKLHGMSFTFGKNGGIDYWDSFKNAKIIKLLKSIKKLPVEKYDLILTDFEPITSWACKIKGKKCISLSHQCSLLSPNTPKPKKSELVGEALIKHYAPFDKGYGFHFGRYDTNIYTPLIRQPIREAATKDEGHITVYLPSFGIKQIHKVLSQVKGVQFNVFTKYTNSVQYMDNVVFRPTSKKEFVASICHGAGVICNAGFETPAETLFLGKKLLPIPMKGQLEQHYNVAALNDMGITSLKDFSTNEVPVIKEWLETPINYTIDYPDETEMIVDKLIEENL